MFTWEEDSYTWAKGVDYSFADRPTPEWEKQATREYNEAHERVARRLKTRFYERVIQLEFGVEPYANQVPEILFPLEHGVLSGRTDFIRRCYRRLPVKAILFKMAFPVADWLWETAFNKIYPGLFSVSPSLSPRPSLAEAAWAVEGKDMMKQARSIASHIEKQGFVYSPEEWCFNRSFGTVTVKVTAVGRYLRPVLDYGQGWLEVEIPVGNDADRQHVEACGVEVRDVHPHPADKCMHLHGRAPSLDVYRRAAEVDCFIKRGRIWPRRVDVVPDFNTLAYEILPTEIRGEVARMLRRRAKRQGNI